VNRPRLVERLETGLRGPLTLIAAPAGYGKTTLMAEWRASGGDGMPAAWISLDAGDNDLITFLRYITAALDTLEDRLTASTSLLLQSEQPLPATSLLTALVNDVDRYPTEFVLALDDCHVITDAEIYAGLDFLIQNAPQKMHLVLLSRSDPALPLARLRERGQMVEIRAEHLRFTRDEAAQFLAQVMDLELTPEQVSALETRSEGWIVGLHMAALSMQGRSREGLADFVDEFTGSHRYIMDYLVGDVLVNQPEAIRVFLLKTSILERLSAWLCQAVTGVSIPGLNVGPRGALYPCLCGWR
jgi:LuxR family maltose regulon positive regulatory protein